jgi:hypothetical protein
MNTTQLLSNSVAYACTHLYVWVFAFVGALSWIGMSSLSFYCNPYVYYLAYQIGNVFWYVTFIRWIFAAERSEVITTKELLYASYRAFIRLWWLIVIMVFLFGSFWYIFYRPAGQNKDLLLLLLLSVSIFVQYGINFFLIPAVVYDTEFSSLRRIITRSLDLFIRYMARLNYLFWLLLLVGTIVFVLVVLTSLFLRPVIEYSISWVWNQEFYNQSVFLITCSIVIMLVVIMQAQFWHLLETKYRV